MEAAFVSLKGQLLVASPALVDPNFDRTVVLVTEHTAEGAMGLVLNRPSLVAVEAALPHLAGLVLNGECVHVGGPVQPEAVVALAEWEDPAQAVAIAFGHVGFLPADVEDTELEGLVRRARVFAGYSGWSEGQLEGELAEQAWIVEPARKSDVFTRDPQGLWSAVLRRKGGAFAILARMPADPSVN